MPNWVENQLEIICETNERAEEVLEKITSEAVVNAIRNDAAVPEKCNIDFNKILPMPEGLDISADSGGQRGLIYLYSISKNNEEKEIINKAYRSCNFFNKNIWEESASSDKEVLEKYSDNLEDGKKYFENFKKYGYCEWYHWRIDNWGTKWNASDGYISIDGNAINASFNTAWNHPEPIIEALSKIDGVIGVREWFCDEDICGGNCGEYIVENGETTWLEAPDVGIESLWFYANGDVSYFCDMGEFYKITKDDINHLLNIRKMSENIANEIITKLEL